MACGKYQTEGCVDGVGNAVRLKQPQQGCFVKNEKYIGREDEYDFYFVDKQNIVFVLWIHMDE